jgi:hypothetical protein
VVGKETKMSKAHRGKGLNSTVNHGTGACPSCGKTRIKVLYETVINEKKTKICKICSKKGKKTA